MGEQWLAVQSFEHGQDLLSAVNTLSIHTKLVAEGLPDEERAEAARQAREKLASFLSGLEKLTESSKGGGSTEPVLGTDPRTRQLAESFVAAKRDSRHFRSGLFRGTIPQARELVYSEKQEDREALLSSLQELRALLQEHVDADAARIMGQA